MFKGLKIVPLDNKARIRRLVKKLSYALTIPDATHLTFIIERKGNWNVQSTHSDDIDIAHTLERVIGSLKQI